MERGEQVIISPVAAPHDGKKEATLRSENAHVAPSYSHVTADKELQEQWGEMRAGQACQSSNYFTPRGNKAPASGVFVSSGVLRVSVSYQNFPRGRYIYTHQNFCDCFGPAISKRQRGGR